MLKKITVAVISTAFAVAASAEKGYSAAGCGLGSELFKGQSGLGPHILAATTNGFYGTQTFAMTSGTLGCDVDQPIVSYASLQLIDNNMEQVAHSIAVGEGEALVALADTLEVASQDRPAFNELLKNNFAAIYPNENVNGTQVYASIIDLLANSEDLAKYSS